MPRDLDLRDEDVREVLHDAFEAIAAKTPGIANPIIDKAVEDDKITEAQADQLSDMQRRSRAACTSAGSTAPAGPGHTPPGLVPPEAPQCPRSSSS